MDPETVAVLAIIFVAFLTRATFGFGDALVGMPLLLMLIDWETAAPLVALISFAVAAIILFQDWRNVRFRQAGWLIASAYIGIRIALSFFANASAGIVLGGLGGMLVLFSSYSLWNPDLLKLNSDRTAPLFGFAAGILSGAYNASGPPLVMYGAMRRWTPQEFRATLQSFFLMTSGLVVAIHGTANRLTPDVWTLFLLSLAVIPFCTWIGHRLNAKFRAESFSRYLHVALIAIGLSLLGKALLVGS